MRYKIRQLIELFNDKPKTILYRKYIQLNDYRWVINFMRDTEEMWMEFHINPLQGE